MKKSILAAAIASAAIVSTPAFADIDAISSNVVDVTSLVTMLGASVENESQIVALLNGASLSVDVETGSLIIALDNLTATNMAGPSGAVAMSTLLADGFSADDDGVLANSATGANVAINVGLDADGALVDVVDQVDGATILGENNMNVTALTDINGAEVDDNQTFQTVAQAVNSIANFAAENGGTGNFVVTSSSESTAQAVASTMNSIGTEAGEEFTFVVVAGGANNALNLDSALESNPILLDLSSTATSVTNVTGTANIDAEVGDESVVGLNVSGAASAIDVVKTDGSVFYGSADSLRALSNSTGDVFADMDATIVGNPDELTIVSSATNSSASISLDNQGSSFGPTMDVLDANAASTIGMTISDIDVNLDVGDDLIVQGQNTGATASVSLTEAQDDVGMNSLAAYSNNFGPTVLDLTGIIESEDNATVIGFNTGASSNTTATFDSVEPSGILTSTSWATSSATADVLADLTIDTQDDSTVAFSNTNASNRVNVYSAPSVAMVGSSVTANANSFAPTYTMANLNITAGDNFIGQIATTGAAVAINFAPVAPVTP